MMIFRSLFVLLLAFATLTTCAAAQQKGPANPNPSKPAATTADDQGLVFCTGDISAADCAMVRRVADHILPAIEEFPARWHTWPPRIFVEDMRDDNGQPILNAFAHPCGNGYAEWQQISCSAPTGKSIPHVRISKRILDEIVQGDAHRLAFLLGHELSHITLAHTTEDAYARRASSELSFFAFKREQELAADASGAQYALAAGYEISRMLGLPRRMIEALGSYSTFEAIQYTHASWEERLEALDEGQEDLWRSLITFRNGVVFLSTEQFALAAEAFDHVRTQFPESYEAHANYGIASLMQYTDALEPADVRRMDIGLVVTGSFTDRPESLEPPARGVDADLWKKSVWALERALNLEAGLTEARANLGLAYLVHPDGPDVSEARAHLSRAAREARMDSAMPHRTRASILINAAVADLAAGDPDAARTHLETAETQLDPMYRVLTMGGGAAEFVMFSEIYSGMMYNAALVLSASEAGETKSQALKLFEGYLTTASPSSAWWPIAYDKYSERAERVGATPAPAGALRSAHAPQYRLATAVRLPGGATVALADPTEEVLQSVEGNGAPLASGVISGTSLRELNFHEIGVRLLATHEVLAIILSSDQAPPLELREVGLGADAHPLRVGMSVADLEALVGSEYESRALVDPRKGYRFYRPLGLAVHVAGGVVEEIVLTQIPVDHFIQPDTE